MNTDQLVVELRADIRGLQASLQRAADSVKRFDRDATDSVGRFERAISRARIAVLSLGSAWAAFRIGKGIVDAGMQMQALQNRMLAATGSANVAAESLTYVREEANRLGLDIRTTADGFAGFAASSLRAGLTFKQTQEIFTGVSEAAVSMRLSAEQTSLVFKALEQIAGKGTVSMEELRGQLGDALPGAFEIAAKAMGKTTAEFNKMVSNGEVLSADFLPKFGEAVRKELGGSIDEATKSAQAAFNRLGNAFFELKNQMAQSGFLDAVTDAVKRLTEQLGDPKTQQGLKDFATLLGQIASAAVSAASSIGKFFSAASDRKAAMQELIAEGKATTPAAVTDKVNTIQLRRQAINAPYQAATPASTYGNYTLGTKSPALPSAAAQKAQQVRERLRQRVSDMNAVLVTEQDPNKIDSAKALASLEKRHGEEQELLENALKQKAITQQEFNENSLKVELDYQARLAEIRKQYRDEFLSDQQAAAEGFLGVQVNYQNKSIMEQGKSFRSSIQQAAQHNRAFFALEKAAAIAQALLSARQSVVDAYKFGNQLGGPALGAAFAGVAAAAQAANIAAIASTSYGGGGGVSSSGGSGGLSGSDSSSSSTSGVAQAPSKNVYISLQGDDDAIFSKNTVRKIIAGINDALSDGSRLNVVVAS